MARRPRRRAVSDRRAVNAGFRFSVVTSRSAPRVEPARGGAGRAGARRRAGVERGHGGAVAVAAARVDARHRHARHEQQSARGVGPARGSASAAVESVRVDRSHGRLSAGGRCGRRQARWHHGRRSRWPVGGRCWRRVRSAARKGSTSISSRVTKSAAWSPMANCWIGSMRYSETGRHCRICSAERGCSVSAMARREWRNWRSIWRRSTGQWPNKHDETAASIRTARARRGRRVVLPALQVEDAGAGAVHRSGALSRPGFEVRGRHATARQRRHRSLALQQREHRRAWARARCIESGFGSPS